MKSTETLLLVNSLLLALVSISFVAIGFFFKDLHKDFKSLVERVNNLYMELNTHVKLFDNLSQMYQKQIDRLNQRIDRLENTQKD
jgi:predicted  nucleic acid-binding Zn-ribbon protein